MQTRTPIMKFKKLIMPFLQAAVTVLLLWWIFHDPIKREQMGVALHSANPWWLVPGFISFGFVLFFATTRWKLLLAVQKISLSWWRVCQLTLIGMFFNLFLLGSTGGDLIKIFYAMKEVPKQKTAIFLSIVIDRIVGMFSLMLVTLVVCGFYFSQFWMTPVTRGLLTTVIIVFSGFFGVLVVSLLVNHYRLWKLIPSWLPGHRLLMDTATAFSLYAENGSALGTAVGYSLLSNIFLFASVIFAAYAFASLPGAPGALPIIEVYPIVNTISAIPISLSGIGVREQLFETLLNTLYDTPRSLAVLISLCGFFLTVLWSLIGGLVYLFYRPSVAGEFSISEMEEQVVSLEESVNRDKPKNGNGSL
ncbi:MAG: lysylphosphatidylglycerol synthase transmembrane domain-containing protein [Chthoniobacterales bacterium]